jgi:hypothetical protein
MTRSVKDIKHVLTRDVDVDQSVDVKTLDAHVFSCLGAAQDAMEKEPLAGFPAFESAHIWNLIGCLSHSHKSIRKLLTGEQNPSAVDALAIARLQLESLYTLCYLLQSPESVRVFLKNAWKKKYIRFLLHREEHVNFKRFDEFYSKTGYELFEKLQGVSSVTAEERRKIEYEQLGYPFGPLPQLTDIPPFPTPGRIIPRIAEPNQRRMLERLYPEYEFLCSFAHGDTESVFFRSVADPRSRFRRMFSTSEMEYFYQTGVLEPPIMYSVLSAVQVATEIAARYPANIELYAEAAKAWALLSKGSLIALSVWEIRAKQVLGAIDP